MAHIKFVGSTSTKVIISNTGDSKITKFSLTLAQLEELKTEVDDKGCLNMEIRETKAGGVYVCLDKRV